MSDDDCCTLPILFFLDFVGTYFHSKVMEIIFNRARESSQSTYVYIVDVTDDLELLGLSADTPGTDKSIMSKLFFGYPYLAYGGKFAYVNKGMDIKGYISN